MSADEGAGLRVQPRSRPFTLTLLYGAAALTIVLAGMHSARGIVTPVFLLGPIGLTMLAGVVDKVSHEGGQLLLLLTTAGAVVAVIWGLITVFQLRGAWGRMGRSARDA